MVIESFYLLLQSRERNRQVTKYSSTYVYMSTLVTYTIALVKEKEMEKWKYQQLYNQLEEKTKQFQKLQVISRVLERANGLYIAQSMYEKLKRKTIQPNMQQQQNNLIPAASSVISSATRMVKNA